MSENKPSFVKIIITTTFGGAVAAILNILIFNYAHSHGYIPDTILMPNQNSPLTVLPVAFGSIAPAIVAGILFSLFRKFFKKAYIIFLIMSVLLLIGSLFQPLQIPNIPMSMLISLDSMHVVVAVCVLTAIKRAISG